MHEAEYLRTMCALSPDLLALLLTPRLSQQQMGLGKTLCVISLIVHDLIRKRGGPAALADNDKGKEKEVSTSLDGATSEPSEPTASLPTMDDTEDEEEEKEKEKESERDLDTPDDQDILLVDESRKNGSQRADTPTDASDENRPTLIVCPLSVLSNWEIQLKQHLRPDFPISVYVYHGRNRSTDAAFLKQHDVVLTTYNILGNELNEHATTDDDGKKANREHKMDAGLLYSNLFNAFAPAFANFPLAAPAAQPPTPDPPAPSKNDLPSALHQINWLRYLVYCVRSTMEPTL